jgi:hypothetical protein
MPTGARPRRISFARSEPRDRGAYRLVPAFMAWYIRAMPTEIVVCRAGKGSTWEGSPEQTFTFETKKGPFTCKSKDITPEAQHALDTLGTVKAEVDSEPDDFGYIRLIRFIV